MLPQKNKGQMQALEINSNGINDDGFCAGDKNNELVLPLDGFPQNAYEWILK